MKKYLISFVVIFCVLFPLKAHAENFDAGEPIKGMYYGAHMFGAPSIVNALEKLLQETEINAVIIDKKDDWGTERTGERFQKLVRPFKARGAHIVCRIVTLKDSIWARAGGYEFAVKSKASPGTLWRDRKGNAYLDPLYEEVADYNIQVSLRAIEDGCEMLNYDYIRLPSPRDGNTSDTKYPPPRKGSSTEQWAENFAEKRRVMQLFSRRLVAGVREAYPQVPLAVSIFGYACYGREPYVGQYLEDFAGLGFTISCMAYPSHYACGDEAPDPSAVPYKIYYKTHSKARAYLAQYGLEATFMPWLQGYDYGNIHGCGGRRTKYANDPPHFRKQIQACNDLGIQSWFVWPSRAAFFRKDLYLPK